MKALGQMRAVYVQHEPHEGLGLLGPALEGEGFTLVRRFRTVKREDLDAELLVVLGGRMGVGDQAEHPNLIQEQSMLSERLALDLPCLGICLGAQLLATAAGSEVTRGKNGLEVGVGPVQWTAEAQKDEVLAPLGARTQVAHWHQDTFCAVPGATLLASTPRYVQQAFRLGGSYGFQFHLELESEAFGSWLDQDAEALARAGKSAEELKSGLGKLKGAEPALKEALQLLAHHFAKLSR